MSARFYRNPEGRGFAGGLPCQAPSEGGQPFARSAFAHPIPRSCRRASGDLFSGSLETYRCEGSVTNPIFTSPAFAAIDMARATYS